MCRWQALQSGTTSVSKQRLQACQGCSCLECKLEIASYCTFGLFLSFSSLAFFWQIGCCEQCTLHSHVLVHTLVHSACAEMHNTQFRSVCQGSSHHAPGLCSDELSMSCVHIRYCQMQSRPCNVIHCKFRKLCLSALALCSGNICLGKVGLTHALHFV